MAFASITSQKEPGKAKEKLTYEDLKLPNYINTSTPIKLSVKTKKDTKQVDLTLSDIVAATVLAGLNTLLIADTGRGKTQLMTDIAWHYFGGDQESGDANWADGRPNFEVYRLFERVKASQAEYDSEVAITVKEERIRRLFNAVDELNRTPQIKQNEFFDLADGKYTFNGRRINLGRDDYTIFMATANMNKNNGEFQGTFEFDRALLNRAHVTIDLDHKAFQPTPEDEYEIEKRKSNPKVDIPPPRDISEKILAAYHDIARQAKVLDPYFMVFRYIIGRGLDYCAKDKFEEKNTAFPALCTDCEKPGKDYCSLVRASSERSLAAIKTLAYAFSYIAELKVGEKGTVEPFDVLQQAFRFTTYHGNLNELIINEEYLGRRQLMMDRTVEKLQEIFTFMHPYLKMLVKGEEPVLICYDREGTQRYTEDDERVMAELRQKHTHYEVRTLEEELKKKGIGTDWIKVFRKVSW